MPTRSSNMSVIFGLGDHHLKSRCIRLAPRKCLAVSFGKNVSPVLLTPSSSLSVASENVALDDADLQIRSTNGKGDRAGYGCCISSSRHNQQAPSSPAMDKQSFSSVCTTNTATTNDTRDCLCQQPINCVALFNEFIKENGNSFPQQMSYLMFANSLSKLDLIGFIYPTTLLINGPEDSVELLCSLWSKRILKAPSGYYIRFVGKTSAFELTTISQSHFTPLAEALYKCIDELSSTQQEITFETISKHLQNQFPSMELPSEEILKTSLNKMIAENKLNFDYNKQAYLPVRNLTPWDEFENLSLSDNAKNEKEDDDIELELKSINTDNMTKCGNLDELFYIKSKTMSTESSSIGDFKVDDYSESKTLLRRNSSLSNDISNLQMQHKANFKRSKSFKLNYKRVSDDQDNSQSLLSKLWKFGHSADPTKSHSSASSLSNSSVKFTNFGSQFPEEVLDLNSIQAGINKNSNKKEIEMQSKGTQTVKSGSEDIVAVLMKQAGKHALARTRHNNVQIERSDGEGCCAQRCSRKNNRCINCEFSLPTAPFGKHRESRGSSARRYKYYSIDDHHFECQKCYPEVEIVRLDTGPSHHSKHRENKYRKHRSASLRHRPHRSSDILADHSDRSQNIENNLEELAPRRLHQGYRKQFFIHSESLSDDENTLNNRKKSIQPVSINNSKEAISSKFKRYCEPLNTKASRNSQENHNRNSLETERNMFNNVLINNSLNLKIEIETSNVSAKPGNDEQPDLKSFVTYDKIVDVNNRHDLHNYPSKGMKQLAKLKFVENIAPSTDLPSVQNGTQFANNIYSHFAYDNNVNRIRYANPELNYANSITALKEQIARAKANFFNAPLSPSTS